MNNMAKFLLLGVGGYLLWQNFGQQIVAAMPGTPDATGTPGQNTVPTTPSNAPSLRAMLVARAGEITQSFDHWNWYYADIRKVSGPTWEDATGGTGDRAFAMTVDEYLATIVPKGFNGTYANKWESASKSYVQ